MAPAETTELSDDLPRPARLFQACTQCRDRKLKCVFDPSDSTDARPCKRCRRESKECTLPPLKRKRFAADQAELPATKRHNSSARIGQPPKASMSAPTSQKVPSDSLPSRGAKAAGITMPTPRARPAKAFSVPEPVIRNGETEEDDDNDGYIMSTAAPWALDFLPVTFCGTISDLSQAFDFRPTVQLSDAASLPSVTDGDERSSIQDDVDDTHDGKNTAPAQPSSHEPNTTTYSTQLDESQTEISYAFGRDLGMDDIFNFVKFG